MQAGPFRSAAHQPDENHGHKRHRQTEQTQGRWWLSQGMHHGPLHCLWEQGIGRTLDKQCDTDSRQQVNHGVTMAAKKLLIPTGTS